MLLLVRRCWMITLIVYLVLCDCYQTTKRKQNDAFEASDTLQNEIENIIPTDMVSSNLHSISDVIKRNPKFKPLGTILVEDNLLKTFKDFQDVTFFAPVDFIQYSNVHQKFSAFGPSEKKNHHWILAYVVPKELSKADIIALTTNTETPLKFNTLNGAQLELFSKEDAFYVRDFKNYEFTIAIANQNATNGIVHGIVRNN